MADEEPRIDPETGEPLDGEADQSEAPAQPGIADRVRTEAQDRAASAVRNRITGAAGRQAAKSVATEAASAAGATAVRSAALALGPEIIAGLLILLAIGVTVISIGFILCVSNGCQGKQAFDPAIDPARNKQDALSVQTIACLNKAARIGDKGDGPLPGECEKPIKAWADQVVTEATALKGKVDSKETAAIKILDDLLTAANKAKGVTTAMKVKEARVIADELSRQYQLAVNNAVIAKVRGYSANAQKIIDYVNKLGPAVCKQKDSTGCSRQASAILAANFPGSTPTAGASLGPRIPGAPDDADLNKARAALADGGIPLWLIRGNGSGQHWIIVLGVDTSNNITYFDPADGSIHVDPSTASSKYTYFFGSPTSISGNRDERGYVFKP